ncbi:MAG: hypothetical protein ACKE51_06660 [Methylococcaceae bacterium]
MHDKLVHRFLMNVAQSLVKYANGIEAYLSRDYVFEEELDTNDLRNAPPAHWIEKVRQGAPHLLDQIEYTDDSELYSFKINKQIAEDLIPPSHLVDKTSLGDEPDSFFHQVKEPDIQYKAEAPEHQLFKLKKKNIQPQPYIFKKITKAVGLLDTQNEYTSEVSLQPKIRTKENLQLSDSKSNENIAREFFNASNKITEEAETELTRPFVSLKTPIRCIEKIFKSTVKNNTTNFHNRNDGRLNKIKQKATETRTVQQHGSGSCEDDLLNNKKTAHLYPKSILQHKAIKFTQRNGVNETKVESSKQECFANDKVQNPLLSDLLQPPKTISKKKKSVLSGSRKIQEPTNKSGDIKITQPVEINNDSYLKFTPKNSSHKTRVPSSRSVDWSSVMNETTDLINQDRWPHLLKQEQVLLSETRHQHFDFWRIQKQAESKFLSDQEQRGRLWNA